MQAETVEGMEMMVGPSLQEEVVVSAVTAANVVLDRGWDSEVPPPQTLFEEEKITLDSVWRA